MIEQEKHCFTKLRKIFKYVLHKIVATCFTQQHRSQARLIQQTKKFIGFKKFYWPYSNQ